jgi:hypothetical protein
MLTITACPRRSDNVIWPPSNRSSVKSGAENPSRGLGGGAPSVVAAAGIRERNIQPLPTKKTAAIKIFQRLLFWDLLFSDI